jgi:hypothetical protein
LDDVLFLGLEQYYLLNHIVLLIGDIMAFDINHKEITIGSYVKYINTGTKGIVKDIKKEDNTEWVLLDNNLMYKPNTLEIIEFEEKKEKEIDEKEIEEILEKENISGVDTNVDACGAG